MLWIHGDPGLGKAFLASSVIEAPSHEPTNDHLPQILDFHCRYSNEQENTLVSFLQCFLLQPFELKSNHLVVWDALDRLRKHAILDHAKADSIPSLVQALSETATQFALLHRGVDGLDELDEPGELVRILLDLQSTLETVLVVIVSRKEEVIMKVSCDARGVTMLPIVAGDTRADASKYVQGRLARLR